MIIRKKKIEILGQKNFFFQSACKICQKFLQTQKFFCVHIFEVFAPKKCPTKMFSYLGPTGAKISVFLGLQKPTFQTTFSKKRVHARDKPVIFKNFLIFFSEVPSYHPQKILSPNFQNS